MAVVNYHSVYHSYPPAFVRGPDGTPWHSWRVLLLPYLDQKDLYDAYNFAEPWNGPNNRKLASRIGQIYLRSGLETNQAESTSFVAVVGAETAWPGDGTRSENDLGDGTQSTLMVVEVPDGRFRWMEPRDLAFDRMSFRINDRSGRSLGSRLGGARVVAADDSVRTLPDDLDPRTLRALITANGGEAVKFP